MTNQKKQENKLVRLGSSWKCCC